MLKKKEAGFTPLEIQKKFSVNAQTKAKPPFGFIPSITRRSGKFLTGFTLIEAMVVLLIISVLSLVVLASYRAGEKQFALERSAHKLAQDIRRVQAMAMGAVECPPGTGCHGEIPPGYGIYLKQGDDFYILYADEGDEEYGAGDVIIGGEIYFEKGKGIYILSADPESFSINFRSPEPSIKIRGNELDPAEATIIIALEADASKTKTIRVNKAGLIEIK